MSEDTKLRIIIPGTDVGVRLAVRTLLREEPGVTLVGESSDLASLAAQPTELKPNVVSLDCDLPQCRAREKRCSDPSQHGGAAVVRSESGCMESDTFVEADVNGATAGCPLDGPKVRS